MDAMTFLETVAGVTRTMTDGSADKPIKIGTVDPAYVTSSYPGTMPKVTFDGETVLSGKRYTVITPGYRPTAGDRVLLAPVGTTYVIIGSVTAAAAAYIGGALTVAGTLAVTGGVTGGLSVTGGLVADTFTLNGRRLSGAESVSYDQGPGGSESNATTTYANIKDSSGATYTHFYVKNGSAAQTDLMVFLSTSLYMNSTGTALDYQIRDSSGATQHMFSGFINPASQHTPFSATRRFTGLAATASGQLTVQWRRGATGAATLQRDQNDYCNVQVREVPV